MTISFCEWNLRIKHISTTNNQKQHYWIHIAELVALASSTIKLFEVADYHTSRSKTQFAVFYLINLLKKKFKILLFFLNFDFNLLSLLEAFTFIIIILLFILILHVTYQ